MAITAEELRILVKAETKKAVSELNRFKKSSKDTSMSLKDMAKKLIGPLSVTAGILLMTKLVKGSVTSSIRYAASVEQITVSFTALLKSADKAQETLSALRDFSVKTPFTFEELAPAAQRLIAFGTAAEDVVDTMKNLGNAAQGNSETLGRLVGAYGKVQAKGRASLEEINMFTEAGVPLMRALGDNLGMTNEELFKFISAGKVGFKEVDDALRALTTGEGQFAGMLEKQSETLNGAMSTLKGSVQELGKSLVEDLIPFLTIAVQKLTALINLGTQKRNLEDIFKTFLTVPDLTKDAAANMGELTDRLIDLTLAEEEIQRILDKPNRGIRATETKFTGGLSKQQLEQKLQDLRTFRSTLERIMTSIGQTVGHFGTTDTTDTGAGGDGGKGGDKYGTLANILRPIPDLTADVSIGMKLAQKHAEGFVETMKIMNEVGVPKILRGDGPIQEWERTLALAFDSLSHRVAVAENETLPAMMTFGAPFVMQAGLVNKLTLGLGHLGVAYAHVANGSRIVTDAVSIQNTEMMNNANNWAAMVAATDAYIAKQEELDQKIKDIGESLKKNLIDLLADSALQLVRDMGEASTAMGDGVKTAADAWGDFKTAIINALPQILLAVGTALIQTGDPAMIAIGLGAVLASFAASYFAGRNAGNNSNSASSGYGSSTPSPDALRIGRTYEGNTTYIHADGSIFTEDEFQSMSINANAAAAGNR